MGVACTLVLAGALLPLRAHLSISTAALILVVPVVFGAVIGGFLAGLVSVVAGFVVYDFEFIPPYRTLSVGSLQNWVALLVYLVVMLLVARVVASLDAARAEAQRGNDVMRRLWELSELLVGDQPVDAMLHTIVSTVHTVFDLPGASLLVSEEGHLVVAASAGEPLSDLELHQISPDSGQPVSVGTARGPVGSVRTIALVASGRPVGILALRDLPANDSDRAALTTFANDAALALERARLREQAVRTQLLEEVDRLRRSLMGAVSHDLRTPLATLKVASSTLAHHAATLSAEDARELHELIEVESDRLGRLVANLLDMTRIEAGVLSVHATPTSVDDLVREVLESLGPAAASHDVAQVGLAALPLVLVDPLLVSQILANLLDNALRHSPPAGTITVRGERQGDVVQIAVEDEGPGVAPELRERVFDRFSQFDVPGASGLGLTIARTFVEALGQRIWYETAVGGGARFVFNLPVAPDREN